MANHSTDFLRFSAYSIKDLITRKLSEDTKLTDQIYEGSNASILIDLISYMYQCLVYQLNDAAAESMFADTQVYKNISRLVKFIGYNPRGCNPSVLNAKIVSTGVGENLRGYWIPFYSRYDTGLTDSLGKKIYFSTKRIQVDRDALNGDSQRAVDSAMQPITLYNGQWKLYNTIFTASGIENETFILDGLMSDASQNMYVAHNYIDIFVQHFETTGEWVFQRDWEMDANGIFAGYSGNGSKLFNNETVFKSLYPGTYRVYTVVLNEDKTYELKFGNGIVGAKLTPGDRVYVFYLDTNGEDGKIETINMNQTNKLEHDASMFGISEELYSQIFSTRDAGWSRDKRLTTKENQELYELVFEDGVSTTASIEESVDKIRDNAPNWFTSGNRLVTRFDYEYYLKNTAAGSSLVGADIVDAKSMNNWEYLATFYKWLWDLGSHGKHIIYQSYLGNNFIASPTRYLQKSNFIRHEFFYADASDANNLYLWLKTTNDNFEVEYATRQLNMTLGPIKLMTAELVACKAINVMFDICAAPEDYAIAAYLDGEDKEDVVFDENHESYIEITLDDNSIYVTSSLQKEICNIILDGFDINKCQLGQAVKYDNMLEKIYAINGIQKVRTVFQPSSAATRVKPRVLDGLAFASWSNAQSFIELGDDLAISNTVRQLEDFQFPVFAGSASLMSKIKIIKKSLTTVNTIKF